MKTQLDLHVYAGLLATFLVIVHSAHKFDSLMDIALMTLLFLVVVGGYVVRHLLIFVGHEVKDWRARLETGWGDLDHAWGCSKRPRLKREPMRAYPLWRRAWSRVDSTRERPGRRVRSPASANPWRISSIRFP